MISFFRKKKSKQIAKDRLKILLISDRVSCSPDLMNMIREDIVKVISKYMKIDVAHTEVIMKQTSAKEIIGEKKPSLYVNIPILDMNQ